ncbi:MAG: hypothetical protein GQ560_03070 [Dehalococcoidia bacterium]|nr:hypothetical protein [Dehalococcoidia bacterium]
MNLEENQIKTIEALANHEEAISELYRKYSGKFPDYEQFWLGLAEEEVLHTKWIRELRDDIEEGTVFFNEGRFNIVGVQTSLNYIKKQIVDSENQEISLPFALFLALDIENALLERKYFEIFEGDSVGLKNILQDLAEATELHRARIEQALNEEKQAL